MCAAVLHALLVQPDRVERGSGAQRFVKVLTDEPKGIWSRWTGDGADGRGHARQAGPIERELPCRLRALVHR